jgi:hypothetical protein
MAGSGHLPTFWVNQVDFTQVDFDQVNLRHRSCCCFHPKGFDSSRFQRAEVHSTEVACEEQLHVGSRQLPSFRLEGRRAKPPAALPPC